MPWDGTELRVGALADGVCGPWRTLLGSAEESVLQPEWADNDSLFAISDRTGCWNLYRMPLAFGASRRRCIRWRPTSAARCGCWAAAGTRCCHDGRLLTVRSFGSNTAGRSRSGHR